MSPSQSVRRVAAGIGPQRDRPARSVAFARTGPRWLTVGGPDQPIRGIRAEERQLGLVAVGASIQRAIGEVAQVVLRAADDPAVLALAQHPADGLDRLPGHRDELDATEREPGHG